MMLQLDLILPEAVAAGIKDLLDSQKPQLPMGAAVSVTTSRCGLSLSSSSWIFLGPKFVAPMRKSMAAREGANKKEKSVCR